MNKRVLRLGTLLAVLALAGTVGGVAGLSALAAQEVDPEAGIVIVSVEPGGPAAEAGVVRGDILQEIDGEAVEDTGTLVSGLSELQPGDEVQLTVLHGDDLRTLAATLGDRDGDAYLGITPACSMHEDVMPWQGGMLPRHGGIVPQQGGILPQHEGMMPWSAAPAGALITEVLPDSPAEAAGLREDDVIVAVDGQEVTSGSDLVDALSGHQPGDTVTLDVERDGEEAVEIAVELGENPDKPGDAFLGVRYQTSPIMGTWDGMQMPFGDMHGFEDFDLEEMPGFHDFDELDIEEFGEGLRSGNILRQVSEDGPAWEAGLREGDMITAVDGEAMDSPQALADAVAEHKPGDEITLTVTSPEVDEERDVQVTLGQHPDDSEKAYLGVMVGGFFMRGRVEGEMPGGFFRWPFDSDSGSGESRGTGPFGFRFRLPFDLDDLPFNLDELPESFQLPWSSPEGRGGSGASSVLQDA